jgi:hypothetical protein
MIRVIEYVAVVGAVKDYNPFAVPFIGQPAVYKLWDIGFRLVTAGKLDGIGDHPKALFDARLCASVDPEHPCVRLPRGDSVSIFDGQL